ncbi:hypothetical protein AB4Y45_33095 [Paraburkholderia sp. EG287A]|uniref:hypothetical protein n=1 Tax=Paraburkholderia sp. EG287A TaxID=3237012 RepID=UPI0034D2D8EC
MKKALYVAAMLAPVIFGLAQSARAQTNGLPPALPFDGHARGVDQSLPPPPPPMNGGVVNIPSGGTGGGDSDKSTDSLHVVLVMGNTATIEETGQSGKAVRTTTVRDGGAFVLKGRRFKAQVKDGEVSLADGSSLVVLGQANSIDVETEKAAATNTAEQMSAGEGVHELKMDASIFSNSSGGNGNGNGNGSGNNNSNGVSRF